MKLLSVIVSLFIIMATLTSCSGDRKQDKPNIPRTLSGPGASLIEVPANQVPDYPYWLGPPRRGAYLFLEKGGSNSGRLVYVNSKSAAAIDAGSNPDSSAIELTMVTKTDQREIDQDNSYYAKSRQYGIFTRTTPLGLAYVASSGRRAVVPLNSGRRLIIIRAMNQNLLNNALALLRSTGQK